MNIVFRRILPAILVMTTAAAAHGQFLYGYYKSHEGSISVGGTSPFSKNITAEPGASNNVPYGSAYATSQQQFTTDTLGFLTSFQFHPKSWAGVEMNYGYERHAEVYSYAVVNAPITSGRVSVTTDVHEFTGAYLFHANRLPFKPFVGIGGGALDFTPRIASNQFRGTALGEVGVDLPASKHIGFRIEGRSLYYRSPNFYTPQISTDTWRATVEPAVSAYYKF